MIRVRFVRPNRRRYDDALGSHLAKTHRAIAFADPLSSINLPMMAPSMQTGKKAMMKPPLLALKICVQATKEGHARASTSRVTPGRPFT
ncbi:MAG: hypothetical protein QNI97_12185 [Desulfobacterales bacterium]|nr:hypothetical protein [Desulfobacterales bacterium]